MDGGKSKSIPDQQIEIEEKGGKSNSISEQQQQIEELCIQMEEMTCFLRETIKPALCVKMEDDSRFRSSISEQISELRYNMSKFRSEKSILLEPADPISPDYKLDMEDEVTLEEREAPSRYELNSTSQREEEEEEEEEETDFTKSAKEGVYTEEQYFASYRRGWEFAWGRKIRGFGGFEYPTTLSPMIFTYLTPGFEGAAAITGSTLQIYSIKIVEIKGNLNWPLHVYGVVAARDTVDYNRNLLFNRTRTNCQELTPEDPFLRLTGPSRAIVALDPVDFEVELKIKDGTDSEDTALLSSMYHYTGRYNTGLYTALFDNRFCTIELNLERLTKTVQATILSVRVVEGGSWPFEYGGRVACSSPPQEVMIIDSQGTVTEVIDLPSRQVVLLDSHGGEMPIGSHGYLLLSRQVVSVELQRKHHYSLEWKESLKVVIQAYSPSGHIAAQGHVYFTPKYSNISQDTCDLGDSKVEIIVAWSRLLRDKTVFVANGYA